MIVHPSLSLLPCLSVCLDLHQYSRTYQTVCIPGGSLFDGSSKPSLFEGNIEPASDLFVIRQPVGRPRLFDDDEDLDLFK